MFSKQAGKGFLMVAAAALWSCGAAMAQGNMPQQPSQGQQQQPMPGQQSAGATAGMSTPSGPNEQNFGDQMFVHDTLEGNDAQLQMSQLAVEKSSSPDVKDFSQKMVELRTSLAKQLGPATGELGISQPSGPSKKQKKEIEKLQALSGPDFDTEYIQAMAKEQQHDLKAFKTEGESGQTANIKLTAQEDEPVLTKDYQVLEKLAQVHNVTLESKK
jgi:putative membrane protein